MKKNITNRNSQLRIAKAMENKVREAMNCHKSVEVEVEDHQYSENIVILVRDKDFIITGCVLEKLVKVVSPYYRKYNDIIYGFETCELPTVSGRMIPAPQMYIQVRVKGQI